MNFKELVSTITRPCSGTYLDHVYSNKVNNISKVSTGNYALSDHLPVFIVRKYGKKTKQVDHNFITYRNLKQPDENKFRESLQKAPCDAAFVFENMDDVVNAWADIFTQVVNDHIPFKQKRISIPAQPRWLTNCILMKMKERLFSV